MGKAVHWDLVHDYLTYKGVEITKGASQSIVHLTEELDRKFMNRPFYWHYRDATNQTGEPMTITLVKDQTDPLPAHAVVATSLHPTFKQLIDAAHKETRWFKAYETAGLASSHYAPLYPWMVIQGVLAIDPPGGPSYWREAALSLTTGRIKTGENLFDYHSLKGSLPDRHVTITPVIQYERAIQKTLSEIDALGKELFKNELSQMSGRKEKLNTLIQSLSEKADKREHDQLSGLYEEKIRLDYPVGGIIYSTES
ncbi:YqhG family protein [Jeotgalibacillus proteolyticus]|uniref:Uncharacterized protein n=1 Tax=Jeotgalibacillus proteolyticus TaxID=2082395 RepID=A0A2S5GEQ6_9BACL|nr:YqhG family protein [Jeotgalibacillus proteolyticus]PPA71395.1 hypothetical protein C4B60_04845 [Jeotgalibacillus proteolyticus]